MEKVTVNAGDATIFRQPVEYRTESASARKRGRDRAGVFSVILAKPRPEQSSVRK